MAETWLKSRINGKDLVMIKQCCYLQAIFNLFRGAYTDNKRGMHIVAGSLGIGVHKPFFEYGAESFNTVEDYMNSPFTTATSTGMVTDAHVWIEDSEGRVYDMVTDHMFLVACLHGEQLHVDGPIIEGVEKSELEKLGMHYRKVHEHTVLLARMAVGHDYSAEKLDRIARAI